MTDQLLRQFFSDAPCNKTSNERGNTVLKAFNMYLDRYYFDFNLDSNCWEQYCTQQDSGAFGVWVNRRTREILTLCEGDISIVICANNKSFSDELNYMNRFYGIVTPLRRGAGNENNLECKRCKL